MFPDSVTRMIDDNTANINPDIGNGLAVKHMAQITETIDSFCRTSSEKEHNGLVFLGVRDCTPEEAFTFITRKRGPRISYDIAESYFIAKCLMFRATNADGETQVHNRIILVPYVMQGGMMRINNARYRISPVMSDRVISVNYKDVFVRLLKAKITFRRLIQTYRAHINGTGKTELVQVTWSNIYNEKTTEKKTAVKPCTPMTLYLFAKFGFTETFKKVAKADAVICTDGVSNEGLLEVEYQNQDWICCESSGIIPRGYRGYSRPTVKLYVKADHYTDMAKQLIAGFFYVADRYHFRFSHQASNIADYRFWQTLLGLIIRRINDARTDATISDGRIIEDMRDHMVSLDEYLDSMYRERLRQDGYHCDTIYDLFVIVMEHIDYWISTSNAMVSSKYDKEVAILYDACFGLISSVNKMYYKLRNLARRDRGGRPITMQEFQDVLQEFLPPTVISRQLSRRPVSSGVTVPGSCMLYKVTTEVVPQHQANATGRRHDTRVDDPIHRLDASQAEVTNFTVMSKADVTGSTRMNPWMRLDARNVIIPDPKLAGVIEKTQKILSGTY